MHHTNSDASLQKESTKRSISWQINLSELISDGKFMQNLTLQLVQENRGLTDLQENKGINRLYVK